MTNLTNLIEILAQQALSGKQQSTNTQQNSGLGGVLGSVLGQVIAGQQKTQTQQAPAGGLGGILGGMLGQLGTNSAARPASTGKSALLLAVLPIILNWIQQQGGIQGALDKLKGAGLSQQVNSWVNPEHHVNNEEVPADQVASLFDGDEVEQLAAQTQQPKQDIYAALATALPQIIDSLTPNGTQTNSKEADTDIQDVLQSISGLLNKR